MRPGLPLVLLIIRLLNILLFASAAATSAIIIQQ
jgi:hypothetical protein